MLARDGYLPGVPCWVDIVQLDLDQTMAFYGGLFDWTFVVRTPEGAPMRYAYALRDGLVAAGVGGPPFGGEPSDWTSYVWVDSATATVAAVEANGGRVLLPPTAIPGAGTAAVCADPAGAVIGLWQPAENRGAQIVNAPGSWNFSELQTIDPEGAERFYGAVFGWVPDSLEVGGGAKATMWRVLGYGNFLAERDPELRERLADVEAPGGFEDAVALMSPFGAGVAAGASARWNITFAVDDADAAVARARDLGATVVTPLFDTDYTRQADVQDPQGGLLTLSEFRPPERS